MVKPTIMVFAGIEARYHLRVGNMQIEVSLYYDITDKLKSFKQEQLFEVLQSFSYLHLFFNGRLVASHPLGFNFIEALRYISFLSDISLFIYIVSRIYFYIESVRKVLSVTILIRPLLPFENL